MLKKSLLGMMTAGALSMSSGAITAQADDMAISADIGAYSQYVWRGIQQNSGKKSVQGDFGIDAGNGLSANVWFANGGLTNNAGGSVTEFDWTVDYSGEINDFSYSLGYIYYSYLNNASGNTGEVYVGAGYGPLSATYYYATNSNRGGWKKGSYLDVALSQNVSGFDLGADFGFYFGKKSTTTSTNVYPTTKKGLGHIDLSISKDVALTKQVTITPSLMVSIPTWKNHQKSNNQFVAGVNFAY